jgi:hypothetical protein
LDSLEQLIKDTKGPSHQGEKSPKLGRRTSQPKLEAKNIEREVVIDDFIRNFLIKMKMEKSLEAFQV